MNQAILIGRLTRDPDVRYGRGEDQTAVGRYTLAVDRRFKREGEKDADFISCVCFGKSAEFAEKYLTKGMKIAVTGRIQTGSYTNREGQKVYTTDIIIESQEFVEKKGSGTPQEEGSGKCGRSSNNQEPEVDENGFMNIPDDIGEIPFA